MNRKELIQRRKQIPARQGKDLQIACGLLPFFKPGMRIGLYIPMGAEADIWQFFPPESVQSAQNSLAASGLLKRLAAPVMRDLSTLKLKLAAPKVIDDQTIRFYPIENLHPGPFGLLEPGGEPEGQQEVVPDLLVIPMLAFWNGYRKGYGKGYYDRYLQKHPDCFRLGIAYDEQEDFYQPNDWDQPLDVIVTPTRILDYRNQDKLGSEKKQLTQAMKMTETKTTARRVRNLDETKSPGERETGQRPERNGDA